MKVVDRDKPAVKTCRGKHVRSSIVPELVPPNALPPSVVPAGRVHATQGCGNEIRGTLNRVILFARELLQERVLDNAEMKTAGGKMK